jgi:hypothetical protein
MTLQIRWDLFNAQIVEREELETIQYFQNNQRAD